MLVLNKYKVIIMTNPFEILEDKLNHLEKLVLILLESTQENIHTKELLGIKEASEILNLKPKTIYNKISNGEMQAIKKGNKIYFERTYLIEWIKSDSPKQQVENFLNKK